MALPEGTVTFLRSDIEGSMGLSRALGARYDELNAEHQAIVRAAVSEHAGQVVRTEGDAFFVVFTEAGAAARAAVAIQQTMADHDWPEGREFRLRIGLHTGVATRAGDDYGGFEVSRAARIAALGWGGQIVVSDPARALISADLPEGWGIHDLGRHRLKGIAEPEQLFQLEAPELTRQFEPLRSGTGATDRLPSRSTTLIGRESELEDLAGLLGSTRLLTLTGPGGTGKTTLALELARHEADNYADGAYLADLQAVHDATQVRGEIARSVGLLDGPTGTAADRLEAYLGSRKMLLIIDNFEQVLEAADVVSDALAASAGTRIIVTSRTALKLRAEQEYRVRPLGLGNTAREPTSEAGRLFVDRVRRVRPEFAASAAESQTIDEICRRVDGLPLAIELCAARAASLPLATIRDRLLANLPLPGSGPRDLPDRQRTIEQTVAWSYDLLEPPLQRLYTRLAAFEDTFDFEQVEQVCGPADELGTDVLDGLVRLTEHSLLTHVDDATGGIRFGWLVAVKRHATERLAASPEDGLVRSRHARAFADLATTAGQHLPGGEQTRWLERLEADDANLRSATRYAISTGDVETALRLVAGLWRHWLQSGRLTEGRDLAARALALPGADAPTPLRVRALDAAGGIAYWSGDLAWANAIYEEELQLAQDIGDRHGEAIAWLDLSYTRGGYLGDREASLIAAAAAESLFRELGDTFELVRLEIAGTLLGLAGGFEEREALLPALDAKATAVASLHDPYLTRAAYAYRAFACLARGEVQEALIRLVQGLRANLALSEWIETALSMQFVVLFAPQIGRPDLAATIHGATQAAFERLGVRPPAGYEMLAGFDPLPGISDALGEEGFQSAVEQGRRLSLEEAADLIETTVGSAA